MLRNVAAIVDGEIHPFELGTVCEVFGLDRTADGLPGFDFAVCAATRAPVPGPGGIAIRATYGLDRVDEADLVIVPAWYSDGRRPRPGLVAALRRAHERGAILLTVCSGVFLLAETGLLDNRPVTCHWYHEADLRKRFPALQVDSRSIYIDGGQIITSAGTSAGVDACLHVVRRELGSRVANGIARRMVVPPHRDGSQAQFVETPVPECAADDDLAALLDWTLEHLGDAHTVESLAARAHLSPRTFARRFSAATGTTPHSWLTRQRVLLAQRVLEESDVGVEEISRQVGFGTADLLRHHFARQVGRSPLSYRHSFGQRDTA
ncbi:MAG: helix-turn-helix domain-containing protein [Mycobacteriales bacterium]